MAQISRTTKCEAPTHVVKCSRSSDTAFVLSLTSKTYTKYTWSNNGEDDMEKIIEVNNKLPDCEEIKDVITGKIGRKLVHIHLFEKIVSFEDEILMDIPDAIFLQRVTPHTKTFDMVCFYGKEFKIISIVDKGDLNTIRDWYPNKIYSCGADPLPLSSVKKYLEKQDKESMYDNLFTELTEAPESSCSEYVLSSSESDDDYVSDEDDEIEAQTASEFEEEEDSEYEVPIVDEEPPSKKIKL